MISIAAVRSASGAATYFAKDDYRQGDYYTAEGSAALNMWAGEGAVALGLSGEVSRETFEGVLNGILPDGEKVNSHENRRAGVDLTLSMPKSLSVMAYVAGDQRILAANLAAAKATMTWVEKNLAEGRKDVEGRKVPIATGNLVYALFQHDTSRALDPQGHVHAVIANLTKLPDGKWQALHADKIWSNNSTIGSIYHAFLRAEVEKLGYSVEPRGKHGTFEISGVPKAVLDAFSQRREQILDKAAELGIKSPQGLRDITTRTRDPKLNVEDREGLGKAWIDRAASLGFTGKDLMVAAQARAARTVSTSGLERGFKAVGEAVAAARQTLGNFLRPHDPLVDSAIARSVQFPADARTQLAVASAVRILGQREAAFHVHLLAKTALDLGLKGVTVDTVERRIGQLLHNSQLLPGAVRPHERGVTWMTTQEALRTEETILAHVEAGRGQARPMIAAADAPERLQAAADRALNPGQLAAATMILSSADRTVVVQGVAGAGKSTMLHAVAKVAEAEGRRLTGLAFQNKMVADMATSAGIKSQTIASFVLAHQRFITERDSPRFEAARERLAGTMLVVDETSMVSSDDMLRLHAIAQALDVDKLVLVGDRQQLSSIDAGKAFAMIQAGGGTLARMDENIRQRTDQLRTIAALANIGKAGQALGVLGEKVLESADPAGTAADQWLGLSAADREATAVFASGRETRAVINQRIQEGLATEGTVRGDGIHLTVYERVNLTREELRYAASYKVGQTLDVGRGGALDAGLAQGRYEVARVLANGKVELAEGRRKIRFDPQKLSPTEQRDRLELAEKKDLHLREGDRIRWTANDKARDLHNAALARVVGVDANGVTVETAAQTRLTLDFGDPMLARLDLAYALNMHMAQGVTTDKAITVMSSHERNLSNQRLFNVGVTRVRDELTMVVDDKDKLVRQLDHNPGNKTSALETVGRLDIDSARNDGIDLSDLPPLPYGQEVERTQPAVTKAPDLKPDRGDALPLLPDRSLGLDL